VEQEEQQLDAACEVDPSLEVQGAERIAEQPLLVKKINYTLIHLKPFALT